LGGLVGEGELEGVTTVDEGALLRAEVNEGLFEEFDFSRVDVAQVMQLFQLLLLRLDLSSGGGNLCVQRVELCVQLSSCHRRSVGVRMVCFFSNLFWSKITWTKTQFAGKKLFPPPPLPLFLLLTNFGHPHL
jgi:hypothetical protein